METMDGIDPREAARMREAADPTTAPERLAQLAGYFGTGNMALEGRRAALVAENPSTPPSTLAQLAIQHPAEVARNRALPVLLLANPAWLRGLELKAKEALVRVDLPQQWLEELACGAAPAGFCALRARATADDLWEGLMKGGWGVWQRVLRRKGLARKVKWHRLGRALTLLKKTKAWPVLAQAEGWGLLHAAARHGWVDVIEALASLKIDLDYTTVDTALMEATSMRQYGAMKALIAAGARPDAMGNRMLVAPIHLADHDGMVILLDAGVSPESRTYNGDPPLLDAVHHGDLRVVRLLLSRGAPYMDCDYDGFTTIACAHLHDQIEVIREFFRHGYEAHPPLVDAAIRQDLGRMRDLLASGADPDERDVGERTALCWAISARDIEMVRLLLASGARRDIQVGGHLRWTIPELAARAGFTEALELLSG